MKPVETGHLFTLSSHNPAPCFIICQSGHPLRCVCVSVCVFNDGGFSSILMVIGVLEWSFCTETHSPPWGSGVGPQTDNGL